ncbi:concanavalin A-like lectin/glucanase domain-containing protein [Infundibulicybe gibba]|nr:concanavalin A-like lectin/glucanase domain-containing protein [Infundibulicybe gibba]
MYMLSALLLLLPLGSLAGNLQDAPLRPRVRSHARSATCIKRDTTSGNATSGKTYTLQDMYQGQSFLNDWEFFDYAIAKNLAFVQSDGTTVLAVDDTTSLSLEANATRIVRITSKKQYNGGLFIADFWAMPHGCSVWPAWWSVGPNWPNAGEIDILEGVHNQPTNQYTIHSGTSGNCTLSTDGLKLATTTMHDQCASKPDDNRGCGFLDTDTRSYGSGFNSVSGGWIKMWHFARNEIPDDITSKKPNPDSWKTPVAVFSSKSCDMPSHFFDHSLIIDTTICGDWAGPTYTQNGCPGTCADAVADPKNFASAKWKINYIAVYQ